MNYIQFACKEKETKKGNDRIPAVDTNLNLEHYSKLTLPKTFLSLDLLGSKKQDKG